MTFRTHHEFSAYCPPATRTTSAQLFSLKMEVLSMGVNRRYVDALIIDGERIVSVPFIRIDSAGHAAINEGYESLGESVCATLLTRAEEWAKSKGSQAHLEADILLADSELTTAIGESSDNNRPLPGMAPYASMFREAERYANLTPFVRGRRILDLNPGYGYGAHTLAAVAATVDLDLDFDFTPAIVRRLWPNRASESHDVAIFLGVRGEDIESLLRLARERAKSSVLISVKTDEAELLSSAGARVVPMTRPGCEALGALDESLGIFDIERRAAISVEVEISPRAARTITAAPKKLRILFPLRPSAERIFGGDVVQIRETAKALQQRGHLVEISTAPRVDASGFDIVHVSNLTAADETSVQIQSVASFPGPIVLMPIFTDHADEAAWGMTATMSVFVANDGEADLREKLDALERRALVAGDCRPPPVRTEMMPGYEQMQREILRQTDFIVANAHAEAHRIFRYLDCEVPYSVAPSCADPTTYGQFTRQTFVEKYGFEDYVLIAGRYEARKNQLMLFEALRKLDYPVLCVGRNHGAAFAHAVRAYRPKDAMYLGFLPEYELAGAFAAARVVVVPSWDEVVSLTSLNAAVSGASMVLTRNSYEHEYFADDAEYCDPGSVPSIRDAVQRAWSTHDTRAERRKILAARALREFNWGRSAELTEAAYYRVLSFNPRGEKRLAATARKLATADM